MLECFSALLLLYVVTCCENITLIWVNKIIPLLPCVVRSQVRVYGWDIEVAWCLSAAFITEHWNLKVWMSVLLLQKHELNLCLWPSEPTYCQAPDHFSQAHKPRFHFSLSGSRSKFKFKWAWHYRSPTCLMACSICSTCSAESTAYLSFKLHLAISYLRPLWHKKFNKLPTFLGGKDIAEVEFDNWI